MAKLDLEKRVLPRSLGELFKTFGVFCSHSSHGGLKRTGLGCYFGFNRGKSSRYSINWYTCLVSEVPVHSSVVIANVPVFKWLRWSRNKHSIWIECSPKDRLARNCYEQHFSKFHSNWECAPRNSIQENNFHWVESRIRIDWPLSIIGNFLAQDLVLIQIRSFVQWVTFKVSSL